MPTARGPRSLILLLVGLQLLWPLGATPHCHGGESTVTPESEHGHRVHVHGSGLPHEHAGAATPGPAVAHDHHGRAHPPAEDDGAVVTGPRRQPPLTLASSRFVVPADPDGGAFVALPADGQVPPLYGSATAVPNPARASPSDSFLREATRGRGPPPVRSI